LAHEENNDKKKNTNEDSQDISELSTEELDRIRKSFNDKRARLATMDDAELKRFLLVWVESLVIANFGLKKQVDILKDILVQLREVKGNPAMMKDIDDAFRDYNRSNF
jgi:hypothetical protein